MNTLITWMAEVFTPKLDKITRNIWVASIQEAIMTILPFILVGSIATIISIITDNIPGAPSFWMLTSFSMGLIGLLIAYLVPANIMEKKKMKNRSVVAGASGIALYLMLIMPVFDDSGNIQFTFSRFGAEGMFTALIVGIYISIIFTLFSKLNLFKNSTSLPDFIIAWFDSLLPILTCILTGWLLTMHYAFDMFGVIVSIFSPLTAIAQTFGGFIAFCFLSCFLYSFGISSWVLSPITFPIMLGAIQANSKLVAAGQEATFINTQEVVYSGWIALGGIGATLILNILMIFSAKSTRLKAIGKAAITPSILNINEPLVFGAPIVFNPILMIPMWLNGIILPAITYLVLSAGMVTIPSQVFQLWYIPIGISTYLVNTDFRGLILLAAIVMVSFAIWYPFFKVYDLQQVKKEQEEQQSE